MVQSELVKQKLQFTWDRNKEKCHLSNTRKTTYVGFEIDSNTDDGHLIKVLPNKIRKLLNFCMQIMSWHDKLIKSWPVCSNDKSYCHRKISVKKYLQSEILYGWKLNLALFQHLDGMWVPHKMDKSPRHVLNSRFLNRTLFHAPLHFLDLDHFLDSIEYYFILWGV